MSRPRGRTTAEEVAVLLIEIMVQTTAAGPPAVTALPQTMPQDHYRSTSEPVFFREKRPSRRGANSQHRKKPGVRIASFHALRFTLPQNVKSLGIDLVSPHLREPPHLPPPLPA